MPSQLQCFASLTLVKNGALADTLASAATTASKASQSWLASNMLHLPAYGVLAGAGVGGVTGYLTGDKKKKDHNPWRRAAIGALAGGAVGGLGGWGLTPLVEQGVRDELVASGLSSQAVSALPRETLPTIVALKQQYLPQGRLTKQDVISDADAATLRSFSDRAKHWLSGSVPDEQVTREYTDLGAKAVNTRLAGVPAHQILPKLPLAGSPEHYQAFAAGPNAATQQLAAEHGHSDSTRLGQWIREGGSGKLPPALNYRTLIQAALGLRDQLPEKGGMAKAGAAAPFGMQPGSVGYEIYRQLPGFHPVDTLVGAGVGAAGGALYHALSSDERPKHRRKGDNSFWRRLLTGAAVGGLGGNLIGDRARRYISNLPGITGYNPKQIGRVVRENGWKGIWEGGVLDRPVANQGKGLIDPESWEQPDAKVPGGWGPELTMRRELLRRNMGVHTDDDTRDFFQDSGVVVNAAGRRLPRIQLHERLADNQGFFKDDPVHGKRYLNAVFGNGQMGWDDDGNDVAPATGLTGKAGYPGRSYSNTLGHYIISRPAEGIGTVRKVWDVAWEPRLAPLYGKYVRDAVRSPSTLGKRLPLEVAEDALRNPEGDSTRGDFLKSMTGRWLMNNVLFDRTPLFQSTVAYDPETGVPSRMYTDRTHDMGLTKDDKILQEAIRPYAEAAEKGGSDAHYKARLLVSWLGS